MQQTVGGDDVIEGLGFALGIYGASHVGQVAKNVEMSQGQAIDIMTYNSYSLQYYSFRKGKIGFGFLKHEDRFLFLGQR